MRRYTFRLESVLRVRRVEQDRARGVVLAATAAVNKQLDVLAAADAAYTDSLTAYETASTADFLKVQSHRSALASAVLVRRQDVAAADEQVAVARAAWSQAAARVGALERLDERQRAEHQVRAMRDQELVVDDLVVARFGRSSR